MHTTSFWLHCPPEFLDRFPDLSPTERLNALSGLGNAFRTVGALLLMCDPRDLGVTVTEATAENVAGFAPDLHLYDNYPGGIGLSGPLWRMHRRLMEGAQDLISLCACESGCPSCVGPPGETGAGAKSAAIAILQALLGQEIAPAPEEPPF